MISLLFPSCTRLLALLTVTVVAISSGAEAQGESGLAVPRFVSVRADEVNVRTGPGVRYPIDWVFVRRDMPVEIVGEYGAWRQIRDWQGTSGWVHVSMLSSKRTIIVSKLLTLRNGAGQHAPPVAQAEPGVIGKLLECNTRWCRIEIGAYRGWVERAGVWGVYPNEVSR
ncbi:MAG: SH3 domain-containing protein [Alphaproteobacteria bacterium]